jgi:peptidoglycan/xylan/chitin deacetylase (PgdA/CDA1 family)
MRRPLTMLGGACHPMSRALFGSGGPASLSVLCWHRVDDGPGPLSVTVSEFEAQLEVIEGWGATILPLEDALLRVGNRTLPRRATVLTFDDGYRSTLDVVWPRLEARGWPATLFAVPGYLDGQSYFPWDSAEGDPAALLNVSALVELAQRGMHIGSHTVSHRWLPRLSDEELAVELRDSRRALELFLGQSVTTLAYPAGHHDARVRAAVAAAGYEHAFSTARGRSTLRTDRYAVRRTVVPRAAEDLLRTLDGAYDFLRPLDAVRERRLLTDARTHPDPSGGVVREIPPSMGQDERV